MFRDAEADLSSPCWPIPTSDEGRKDGLISSRRDPQKINDRNLVLEGFLKPAIVWSVWILAHEGVVHHLVAVENLTVNLTLIVVPHAVARFRKHCVD